MALANQSHTGNGVTRAWSLSFPYINKAHIKLTINGTPAVISVSGSTVTLDGAVTTPPNGAAVYIYRDTPMAEPLVQFTSSTLNDTETNRIANLQAIYSSQERKDQADDLQEQVTTNKEDIEGALDAAVDLLEATAAGNFGKSLRTSVSIAALAADAAARAGKFLAFDNDGNPIVTLAQGSTAEVMGFLQSGSGAVMRTVAAKLQDTVSVKDFGATGNGTTDDSPAFALAGAQSKPVRVPRGTYAIKSVTISASCPGFIGEPGAVLVPAAGATSSTTLITVTKLDGFYFRNLKSVLPISTDPGVAPACNTTFRFSTSGVGGDSVEGVGWEVTGCHITGGSNGIITNGRTRNGRFCDNYVTETWIEGIQIGFPRGCFIDRNHIENGGYGGPSGAIRTGGTTSAFLSGSTSICDNKIFNWAVASGQSAIDCFTASAANMDVSRNLIVGCGSGIEIKTQPGPGTGEVYTAFKLNQNTFRMLAANGSCIRMAHDGGAPGDDPLGKATKVFIEGNDASCLTFPNPALVTMYGITISGYEDVTIKANNFVGISRGVDIAADGVPDDTNRRIDISLNTFDTIGPAIASSGGTTIGLRIHDNPLLRSSHSTALNFNVGAIINLTVERNHIHGVKNYGMDVRNVTNGLIRGNTIIGGEYGIYFLGTTPTNITVEDNRIRTTYNAIPAVSGTVSGAGTGLTNGTRVFTATSGTGTIPTIFSCEVTGGTITGAVVIIQPGSYSSFPSTPTVTVDAGVVGGATFSLTGAVADNAVRVDTGSGIEISRNKIDVAVSKRALSGAGSYAQAGNVRGIMTSDPSSTVAASVGEVMLNGTPTSGGFEKWIATTAGNAGAAVWKQAGAIA